MENPVGVVLRVLVLGDELPQDHQHAVIGLPQFAQLDFVFLVERPIATAVSTSEPPQTIMENQRSPSTSPSLLAKRWGFDVGQNYDQQDAGDGSSDSVPPTVKIGREDRGQRIETE